MKIAVVHFGKKGAGPAIALEMSKALSELGHEILYYASDKVENRSIVEKENFEKRFFSSYDTIFSYIRSVIYPKIINKVIEQIKADNPDVVYSPMNDMWLPFIFPRLKKYKRIKTIHDVGVHEGNNSIINKWWNNTNFHQAEKFVILSKKYIPKLVERGIDEKQICVIPHAGFDYYTKIAEHNVHNNYRSDLLFFGRIDKYKGINVLLEAMKIVIKHFPNIVLNIVGNGDLSPYQRDLKLMEHNVRLYNRWIRDEEVADFVGQTDVVVLPYTHATQSGVIPLAYAFSKPVIATNVGCLDEQVMNGSTGIIISGSDVEALAKAIGEMLVDRSKLKEMGQKAHSYMQKNLTWKSSAQKLIDFIDTK